VRVELTDPAEAARAAGYGDLVERQQGKITLRLPRDKIAGAVAHLLSELSVADLTVEDPPIEEVIDQVFQKGVEGQGPGGGAKEDFP